MSELLMSKKFAPVYFIAGLLGIILFRSIGFSWLEVFITTFLCFSVGIFSVIQNFFPVYEKKTRE